MTDTAGIEAALRNPACSTLIEGYEIGPQHTAYPYLAELHQLIPLREHERPWILVTVEAGEREIGAYGSLRRAEGDLADAVDGLTARYNDAFGEDDDSDED
jgi:hypothetical protein